MWTRVTSARGIIVGMSPVQKLTAAVIAVLLIAAAYGVWVTEPSATAPARASKGKPALPASSAMPVIDQDMFRTARRLGRLATTGVELTLAVYAVQIADQVFALEVAGSLGDVEEHPALLSPAAQSGRCTPGPSPGPRGAKPPRPSGAPPTVRPSSRRSDRKSPPTSR